MGYYIGTLEECKKYNKLAEIAEGITGNRTQTWSVIREHPTLKDTYAVTAHEAVPAEMQMVKELDKSWFPER